MWSALFSWPRILIHLRSANRTLEMAFLKAYMGVNGLVEASFFVDKSYLCVS